MCRYPYHTFDCKFIIFNAIYCSFGKLVSISIYFRNYPLFKLSKFLIHLEISLPNCYGLYYVINSNKSINKTNILNLSLNLEYEYILRKIFRSQRLNFNKLNDKSCLIKYLPSFHKNVYIFFSFITKCSPNRNCTFFCHILIRSVFNLSVVSKNFH